MSLWRAGKTSLTKLIAPSTATRSGASLFARSNSTQVNGTIIKGPKTPEELERQKVAAAEANMGPLSRFFVKLIDKTGFGNWYLNSMGYRKYGLKFEDLLVEYPEIQEAVKRLPKEEQEARMKRIQVAVQLNGTGKILPKEQWTTTEQDKPYLRDYILQVQQEIKEREAYRRK